MLVWVHTSPKRNGRIHETLESLDASDVCGYEVHCAPGDLWPGDNEWWRDRLLEFADRCDWFIRLEDDVLVNQHLLANVALWQARQDPLFGVGMLIYPGWYEPRTESTDYGTIYPKAVGGAQGVVFRSEVVSRIAESLINMDNCAAFDGELQRAVKRQGLRTYVHNPSLVTGASTSSDGSASNRAKVPHVGRGFDASWRR